MEEILLNREEPANTAPIIEFRGVSKTYPTGTHALEDVNITINITGKKAINVAIPIITAFCLILKPFHFFNKTFHINITT